MPQYLTPAEYAALVQALLTGAADQHDRQNSIKITLGEVLDIWPELIQTRR